MDALAIRHSNLDSDPLRHLTELVYLARVYQDLRAKLHELGQPPLLLVKAELNRYHGAKIEQKQIPELKTFMCKRTLVFNKISIKSAYTALYMFISARKIPY